MRRCFAPRRSAATRRRCSRAELLEAATRKFTTEQGIRRALEHEEFELLFQPEVRLDSLQVGLVEALVRWRMPDGRLASPAEFLAVTEESGLILELGDWVLRRAIEAAANWQRTSWPEVKVAINVSPRQLLSTSFVDRVQQAAAGVRAAGTLHRARAHGIGAADGRRHHRVAAAAALARHRDRTGRLRHGLLLVRLARAASLVAHQARPRVDRRHRYPTRAPPRSRWR